ncbi:hypothetical protein JOC37_002197 [Desulfohalotomaculum tongense]|nr:hypothetical protein [Desulforadius tongensis]
MVIAYDFGLSVKEYAVRGKDNDFPVIDCCPHCQGLVNLG